MKKVACEFNSCFLCRFCLKEWKSAVNSEKKTYYFKKGETIFLEGDPVKGIFFLYNGIAKVHKKWGEDKELIVRFARKGDILGHRGLGKNTSYPVSATALENVTVCYINMDFFKSTLKVNSEFAYNLLMFFADELQESEKRMNFLAHMQVKERIFYCLLRLKEKFGTDANGCIDFTFSRQDLASFAGTTYETVYKVFNELTEEGLIISEDKRITINNPEKLMQMVH